MISHLCDCQPSQQVEIAIVENFNNGDYQLNNIEFTLTHTEVSFTSAVLKLRTSLFGVRYLMRHWFFTTALVTISIASIILSVFFIGFYFVLRSTLRIIFIKLYPEAKKLDRRLLANKKLAKFDLSQEQTDDLFTSGDSASSDDGQPKKSIKVQKNN